ncbi:hypothetical protein BX070DRAFT_218074 [Coemansia spiralis]|nr:hypothetical protein BX070DRAFT_218074 [Coemansia spiralis]
MDTDEEEAALLADPMINNEVAEDNEADQAIRDLHRKQDFDQDEKDIQSLAQDIKMGRLKNRVLNRTGFALDEEDYIDRQTRAERMEERVRQRRKMLAKEIHDSNLAEIARNPETAAFAQAALMRPIAGDQSETEDVLANAFELEEEVDDRHIAMAVQHQLARSHRRIDSDVESDAEGNDGKERIRGAQRTKNRIAAKAIDSSESVQGGSGSFDFGSELGDDVDGDVFTSVAVEKLIVRRKTLMAGQDDGHSKQSGVWPAPKKTLLKRPGVSLIGASSKKSK